MKRALVIIFAVTTLAASAFAQRPGGPPPGGPGAGPFAVPGGPPPGGDPLAEYLGLTADQKSAWQKAHQDLDAATKTLRDQIGAKHEQMRTLMDARSNDAAALGAIVIAIRNLTDQIRAAHEATQSALSATLNADQKAKFAAFEAAAQFLRQHQGPQGPPPGGPGGM